MQNVRKSVANANGFNMEKTRQSSFWILKPKATNTTERHLINDDKDITELKRACICKFYKNLFEKNISKSDSERESLLNSIALPNLNY